jgi:hypothetical protein
MREARELAGVTFAPDMSPTRRRPGIAGGYDAVQPKIRLSPDGLQAYLSSLKQKRQEKEAQRRRAEQQRKVRLKQLCACRMSHVWCLLVSVVAA